MSDESQPPTSVANALLGYSQPAELLPIPAFRYAQPSEYAASLAPKDALIRLGFEKELAVTQLHRELDVTRIVGIAEQVVWRRNAESSTAYYFIVPVWFWNYDIKADSDFWDTGYHERGFPTKGYGFLPDNWIRLYAVRFWFNTQDADTPQEQVDTDRPAVPRSDLARWHEVFKAVHPDAVEAFAMRSAEAMFPDHRVPRQWVRDLRGPQKRGKPRKDA